MARSNSRLLCAALVLTASSTGCTVYSYSMPPHHAQASHASAPRYEQPRYEQPRYARAPHKIEAERPIASAAQEPKKASSYTPAKPAPYTVARKPSTRTEHEPKKPLAYTPVKPKKPLVYTPVKPKKDTQAHKVASTGVLGATQKPKAEPRRGGVDSIRDRVAAMARKKQLEVERARKKRMQDALAAATRR
jgi:hypothetical protein